MNSVLVFVSIQVLAYAESTSVTKPPAPYDNPGCWNGSKPKNEQECNKEIILQFYQKVFFDQDPNAIDHYIASYYIQHNPFAANGRAGVKEAIPQLLKGATSKIVDIKRVSADENLVWVHSKMNVFGKESAVVDIFRLKDGKIEEHWDVVQTIPDNPRNSNTMF